MKTISAELKQHLLTGATTMCRCWKLETQSGDHFGFSDHDHDISFDGVTYEAASGFTGSEIENSLGLSVDNLDVDGALSSSRLNEKDLLAGVFDNAVVEIWSVNWSDTSQRILLRKGNLGEVSHNETGFSAEIRGLAHQLNQPMGRVFQKSCDTFAGSASCMIDLDTPVYSTSGNVISMSDNHTFIVDGLEGYEDGWFTHGLLVWLEGANEGRKSEIKYHHLQAGGVSIQIWQQMPDAIAIGDRFSVSAGCDKRFTTCRDKFANIINFQGFPFMPGNDFVTFYPNRDDGNNDGSSFNS